MVLVDGLSEVAFCGLSPKSSTWSLRSYEIHVPVHALIAGRLACQDYTTSGWAWTPLACPSHEGFAQADRRIVECSTKQDESFACYRRPSPPWRLYRGGQRCPRQGSSSNR